MAYVTGLESNKLKDFSVSIDGILLSISQVNSIKIKWDIENLKLVGQVVFHDLSNLLETLPIRGNNEVILAMTDSDGFASNQKMITTDIKSTKTQSGVPIVSMVLVDPLTINSIREYKTLSWGETDASEIISKLIGDNTNKNIDFEAPQEKMYNFVTPLNVSTNILINHISKINNMMLFQTREDIKLKSIKELFSQDVKGEKYYYKASNNYYRRKIYEYKTSFGDVVKNSLFLPDTEINYFDVNDKGVKSKSENLINSINRLDSLGEVDPDVESTGIKHLYKSNTVIKSYSESMWNRNSYKNLSVDILVPGQFNNNVGDVVELALTLYRKSDEGEKNINGNWLITQITDIVEGLDFIQRISLSRAKYSE